MGIYSFTCPKCTLGTYVGCSLCCLKVRINNHQGVSHRTLSPLSTPENYPIRDHCNKCKYKIDYPDFKILKSVKNKSDLLIAESLLFKSRIPTLNRDNSSTPNYCLIPYNYFILQFSYLNSVNFPSV